jgi:hypothetical protein
MISSNNFGNLDSRDEFFLALVVAFIPVVTLAGMIA